MMGSLLVALLWWLAVRTSGVDPSQPLPSQLRKMARNKNHCGAPASDCAFLGPPAKYTGRYAVFMAGRVRVAHLALQKAKALIARRYAGKIRVDWYAHVWYNESSLCERRALEELTAIATAITTEPVACMWSWGETGFVNQWHGVDGAFQTLLRFGRLDDYTLVLKTRVDVAYDDLDFEALWARYGASASANASGGHFMVLGASSGWDVHMVGTPPPVWTSNLQLDFNMGAFECFDTSSSVVLRGLDESNRFVQNQPNRLRFDRAREFQSLVGTSQTSG